LGELKMAKILIIDDDPDIVQAMRIMLKDKGYSVISEENAEKGIKSTWKEKPDLIILDVMMPGQDGFEVARILKKDPNTQKIPILMLTAVKDKMGFDFAREAGNEDWLPVDDYCDKPLDHKDLIAKVGQLLNKA
jgi:two-component system alkaline phosphatase synthesis response regulator PhoP